MALTITFKEEQEIYEKCGHNYKLITGSIAFDSSYPTGGEAMDLSNQIPTDLHMVTFENKAGYSFEYDYTNKKVKAFTPNGAHSHDIKIDDDDNAATAGVAVYFDEDAAAQEDRLKFVSPTDTDGTGVTQDSTAAVAAEVANATDLSALTDVRFMAVGK